MGSMYGRCACGGGSGSYRVIIGRGRLLLRKGKGREGKGRVG